MANNQLLASDSFASGSLAAGWTAIYGDTVPALVNVPPYVAQSTATSTSNGIIWTGLTWPADQCSELTAQTWTNDISGTYLQLMVRWQPGAVSGYELSIYNNNIYLYKVVAGAVTQLGNTTAVTAASGDVWSFQALGAGLFVYQNEVLILYFHDTTYSTGSPGFQVYSAADVTHVRVGSWRGYSAIQQDGIWQKQGCAIPPISTDFPGTGHSNGTSVSSRILYEANPQLISPDASGKVYKVLFSSGADIAYAESTDGKIWTRNGSSVLANACFPGLIKSGTTYYLYTTALPNGTSNIQLHTSADMIHWSPISSNVFSLGAGGQWDDSMLYLFTPVYISGGGTWYALYSGGHGTTVGLGLATSSDGETWARYGSNPVSTGLGVWAATPTLINGTWYMWSTSTNPGMETGYSYWDPADGTRIQSTDLITWTNLVHSNHHTQMAEGLNTFSGFSNIDFVMQVGNQTYMYYDGGPKDDDGTVGIWQYCLAIANAPVASIIAGKEDAVTQIATDSFTSGSGDLSANWAVPTGGTKAKIVSGPYVEPTALSTLCAEIYTGATFANDQYSELTLRTLTNTSNYLHPIVRATPGALTWYQANITGATGIRNTTTCIIYKIIAGTATQIGPICSGVTPQVGDVFRLSVVGNVLTLFQNGFVLLQVQDLSNAITSGYPGFSCYSGDVLENDQISSWAGGNANSMPFATVSGALGAGGAGATVSYTGTTSGSVTADGSGNYSRIGLLNGSYTITPSKTGYTFSPTSASETVSGVDITGVDFGATQTSGGAESDDPTVSFLGSVTETTDSGLGGAYLGRVRIVASARAGNSNPYLGRVFLTSSAPTNLSNPLLGEVVVVTEAPAGLSDPYLGQVTEE